MGPENRKYEVKVVPPSVPPEALHENRFPGIFFRNCSRDEYVGHASPTTASHNHG